MKQQFKVGDLIFSDFHNNYKKYGLGIIIKIKKPSLIVKGYCVQWANYHSTWETSYWLKLKARGNNV